MSLMKFVSTPETAVHDSLLGLKYSYPSLTVDSERRIVIYNQIVKNRVCLLCGGGSGHEPFSAGFVGSGMLSGAVAGLVFASPPSSAIYSALSTLAEENNNAGVLIIVMNYTGDILNFGLAAENAKAVNINLPNVWQLESVSLTNVLRPNVQEDTAAHTVPVDTVVVDEDCSRTGSDVHGAGRRGMCGACFVFKIGGGMAENGKSLSDITDECRLVNKCMATLGAAVSSCTIPGAGSLFNISPEEVDIGLGIHGEAGVQRKKMMSIDELVDAMVMKLTAVLSITSGSRVCVLVNNLGSVSQLEMGIITNKVYTSLNKKNITVVRLYSGHFVTSLDMAGFQISILNVSNHAYWLDYLDSATDAPAWNGTRQSIPLVETRMPVKIKDEEDEIISEAGPKFAPQEALLFQKCLISLSNDLIAAETRLNELDSLSGDGDAGSTLKRFAAGILSGMPNMKLEYPALCVYQLAKLSQNIVGGSSGALYGILLSSAAKYLFSVSTIDWSAMCRASIDTLLFYSKAKVGNRTMVDVLLPASEEFNRQKMNNRSNMQALVSAVSAANVACDATKNMKPKFGRASYVPDEYIKDVDPGAYGVTIWLNAILKTLQSTK